MKLKTIIFENFRQFYGVQRIKLETTDSKNLVVIHAENNVGKTTFLKGFTWCLFKKENFKRKAYLNDYVFSQLSGKQTATASVEVIFDDRNIEYSVKRSIKVENIDGNQYPRDESLVVMRAGEIIENNQQDTINRILNPELSGYFFFEGESIGEMSLPEHSEEIEKGIKYIMGLEVYERAITHTKNAKEYFRKSVRDLNSSENNGMISPVARRAEIQVNISDTREKIKHTNDYITHKEREKKDIKDQLRLAEDVERYEKEIQRLEAFMNTLKQEDDDLLLKIKLHISKKGFLATSNDVIQKVHDFLQFKRNKGELPSDIKETFIKDLIDAGKCICGTSLTDNHDARKHLSDLLHQAVHKDIEDGFYKVFSFTQSYLNSKVDFSDDLQTLLKERQNKKQHMDVANAQLEEEKTKRQQYSGSNSAELIRKLNEVEETITERNRSLGEHNNALRYLENELQQIEIELKDYHAKNSKIDTEEKRLTFAQDTLALIEQEYNDLTDKVRDKLTDKVAEIFDSIIHGNYRIKINKNFELELTKVINDQEGETELSRGQEQIASLSFIASLVHIAKKWDEEHKHDVWGGAGIYPMVMDSPFGTLGQVYQSSLTKKLKDLAPQIIVMVSSSQWTSDVSKNFAPYCQHEYVFVHNHPEDQLVDRHYDDIIIDGQAYPLEQINDFEYTKIVEVK